MLIKEMFERDIERSINGVIKVDQDDEANLEQELSEYVVTNELRGHFATFYDAYDRALDAPTDRVGVWISGFFGSGKSHFLKMLSYLLTNREAAGRAALDYIAPRFEDERIARQARRAASVPTEAILFNIDSKAKGTKGSDSIPRAFARTFYENQGFYGSSLKLARLEAYIERKGKTQAFRDVYQKVSGVNWLEDRPTYDFNSDLLQDALTQAGVMSAEDFSRWIDSPGDEDLSIDNLTDAIRDYAEERARANGGQFRLLFMVDEIGQFIGADTSLMLNLQTLVEELGTKCAGRVWVVVTSQEAIDEVTRVAGNDFSKIQGRFNTRLSLSSSSADEVIKRRVLEKTPDAANLLRMQYAQTSAVLKNLFSFSKAQGDLAGYADAEDFVQSFPFTDYQFTLMQDVMTELRKQGSSGKHLSSGERSMLSGFQEATQGVEDGDENTLVPFWRFYDTLDDFLESYHRQVINRAAEAAQSTDRGLEPYDVSVLKLLFLLRWVDKELPANVDNVVTLMTDDVRADRMALRERVQASLDRLVRENYVARDGDHYQFLTDDEQEIAQQIGRVTVDAAKITRKAADILFRDIFETPKLQHGRNVFPVEEYLDETLVNKQADLTLRVVTGIGGEGDADPTRLALQSAKGEAIVALSPEQDWYTCLFEATQIDQFMVTRNLTSEPENRQDILQRKQRQRSQLEKRARDLMEQAVLRGTFYANGERVTPAKSTSAKRLMEDCVERLVSGVYGKLDLIERPCDTDEDIRAVLSGKALGLDGQQLNGQAADEMARYLAMQARQRLTTTMGDVQRRFQAKPYGWRETDVAGVAALLVAQGRAKLSYAEQALEPSAAATVQNLRSKSKVDKTVIEQRQHVGDAERMAARAAIEAFSRAHDLPTDEDGLAGRIGVLLRQRAGELHRLLDVEYRSGNYPGREDVASALALVEGILKIGTDPADLLVKVARSKDDLADAAEDLEDVDAFFANQRKVFDDAAGLLANMEGEREYLVPDAQATQALDLIREVLATKRPYRRIKELPGACQTVRDAYEQLLRGKREEALDQISQMFQSVRAYAEERGVKLAEIDRREEQRQSAAHAATLCTALDAIPTKLGTDQTSLYALIDAEYDRTRTPRPANTGVTVTGAASGGTDGIATGHANPAGSPSGTAPAPAPKVRKVMRAQAFPPQRLESTEQVDAYLKKARERLLAALDDNDSIQLS